MKIPYSQENPIDVLNIFLASRLSPLFKWFNFTPNDITTLSLFFGVLSLWYLYTYNFSYFAITFYISYFFDCMDGYYARRYKMVSKFGDYYDHVKDLLLNISVIIILLKRYKTTFKVLATFISIIIIFTILMGIHFGCQERIYHREESDSLSFTKKLCPGDPVKNIQYTRWFGCGTYIIVLIYSIFYLLINRI